MNKFLRMAGAMQLSCGKLHLYLGMNLDYSVVGEVKITMVPYVLELVTSFKVHDPFDKTAITPASENLFACVTKNIKSKQIVSTFCQAGL